MGPIPPDKSWEEIDREAVKEVQAQRAAGEDGPYFTSDQVYRFLQDLEKRFTEAGRADPAIAQELIANLRREVGA
jgi:hypothetical protein